MRTRGFGIQKSRVPKLYLVWSNRHRDTSDLVSRRSAIIMPAIATGPYSNSNIQEGTDQGRPSVRKCQTMYMGTMLTVQMMIGRIESDLRNGSTQRRYQGYTTGANRSDSAMGKANTSGVLS